MQVCMQSWIQDFGKDLHDISNSLVLEGRVCIHSLRCTPTEDLYFCNTQGRI